MCSEGPHGGHVEGDVARELKAIWPIDPRLVQEQEDGHWQMVERVVYREECEIEEVLEKAY